MNAEVEKLVVGYWIAPGGARQRQFRKPTFMERVSGWFLGWRWEPRR
jgi:hypothetical protein